MSIHRYTYGASVVVELDADEETGVLLFAPPALDVHNPLATVDEHGRIRGPLSLQEADWADAMRALFDAGYELGNDGEAIGQRDGWEAYPLTRLVL